MKFVVKNTTSWYPLDWLCPHICRGCGYLGASLCERCKKNLCVTWRPICPICQRELASPAKHDATWPQAKCHDCDLPFVAMFVGGWREGVLAKLIKEYKYQAIRAHENALVDILDTAIRLEAKDVVVVPLPTIGKHVRARGIDHTRRLAMKLARRRGWQCKAILSRAADTVQVGASAAERQAQAKQAYVTWREVDPEPIYLLLDDIWTTGASLVAACKVLQADGAKHIAAAVLAASRQKNQKRFYDERKFLRISLA